jgi:hypothetical protein
VQELLELLHSMRVLRGLAGELALTRDLRHSVGLISVCTLRVL